MSRRDLPRFAGLRDGDLIRIARRVSVIDMLDGAAFCLVAVVVVFAVLAL